MKIGKCNIRVYLLGRRKVIRIGSCGNNSGYVQDVETLEEFKTDGYNTLSQIGTIDITVSANNFKLTPFN